MYDGDTLNIKGSFLCGRGVEDEANADVQKKLHYSNGHFMLALKERQSAKTPMLKFQKIHYSRNTNMNRIVHEMINAPIASTSIY